MHSLEAANVCRLLHVSATHGHLQANTKLTSENYLMYVNVIILNWLLQIKWGSSVAYSA
jgi:hypothetical protein